MTQEKPFSIVNKSENDNKIMTRSQRVSQFCKLLKFTKSIFWITLEP